MPNIAITVQAADMEAIKAVFGGVTNAETLARVKAFLGRAFQNEMRAAREYAASEAFKAANVDIVVG